MQENLAEQIIDRMKEMTSRSTVTMKLKHGTPGITDSKVSGIPFIPVGGEYPVDAVTGDMLYLLIQINFAQVPHIPDFPEKGILQVFIGGGDCYGCDFDDMTAQNAWRVLYHEDISDPMSEEQVTALMETLPKVENPDLPFEEEGAVYDIVFTENTMAMSFGDFRFVDTVWEKCEDIIPDDIDRENGWYDIPDEISDEISDELSGSGSRLGGYSGFTQDDPRGDNDELSEYELLLQLDSEGDENDDWALMFGDSGILNIFIRPEDLKNKDFSNVMYNWDCC